MEKNEHFLVQIEKKYNDKIDIICTDGYVYWIIDNLGEKIFFDDLSSFENAIRKVESEKTLYDSIKNSFIYSDKYLNKMNKKGEQKEDLNIVDTDTMTFKFGPESVYSYFSSYVFNDRVRNIAYSSDLSISELIKQYFPMTQISEDIWIVEDKLDDLYVMTLETRDDEIKSIDIEINNIESETQIIKELADGVRTIVSNSSSYRLWALADILRQYDYDVSIPVGVNNVIIHKQIKDDKTHIIVQTGFEDDYIEILKSK